jgi:ABC-type uncharacterized transport system ATPase subunit
MSHGGDGGADPSGGAAFLEIHRLTKTFGGVRAVDAVDFTLKADEMWCVIGPNGCGKTTLFNLVTGYLKPTTGTIRFNGRDILGRSLHAIAQAGIVRKFQVPSIFAGLTVTHNLGAALAVRRHGITSEELDQLLAMVRLDRHRNQLAGTLSHGQKQWLELAMVLAVGPRLILLDEPTAGMTRAEKAETIHLIRTIRGQRRVAALIIEHDMDFVEALGCPVSVMITGRIVATGGFDTIRADPAIRNAYFGSMHG